MKAPGPLGWIITAGSVLGAITAALVFWGDYGWIPGKQYRAEHVSETSADDIGRKLNQFMLTWQCDEWSEELPDHERDVDRLKAWWDRLEPNDPNHDRAEDAYYKARHERDTKKKAFDEANCESLVE